MNEKKILRPKERLNHKTYQTKILFHNFTLLKVCKNNFEGKVLLAHFKPLKHFTLTDNSLLCLYLCIFLIYS